MCLFRFGQLRKRRTHSQSHSCLVQQHDVQERSIRLLMEHCSRSPLKCDLAAKVAHVGRFAGAARAHRQPTRLACPADARAWARWPSGALNLPTSSSPGSHAKGAMLCLWKTLGQQHVGALYVWHSCLQHVTEALSASASEISVVFSGAQFKVVSTSAASVSHPVSWCPSPPSPPNSQHSKALEALSLKGTFSDVAQTSPWHWLLNI